MKRVRPLYFLGALLLGMLLLLGSICFGAAAKNTDILGKDARQAFLQNILDHFDWENFPWEDFPFDQYQDFPWEDLPWEDLPADFDWNQIPWDNLPADFDWGNVPWQDAPEGFDWDRIPWDNLPEDFPWQDMPWDNMPENFDYGNIPWDNLPEDFPWQDVPWQDMGEDFPWEDLPWEDIPPEMLPFLGIPWLLVPPDAVPDDIFPEGFFPWEHEHEINPLVPWTTIADPTCGEVGTEINYCVICKQMITRDIPATGRHVFTEEHRCGVCGKHLLVCTSESFTAVYGDAERAESRSAAVDFARSAAFAADCRVEFSNYASLSAVGRMANTFSVTVYDGEGNDITEDFVIERFCGALEVTERQIVLKTESAEKQYDGSPLVHEVWSAEGLAEGDILVDVVFGEGQTEWGRRPNEIVSFRIVNAKGEDVTRNYAITPEWGQLVVKH